MATITGLSEESIAARAHGIGASEVASIVGASPYQGPLEVYQRKVRALRVEPEPPWSTLRTELGHLCEPVARELYRARTGIELEPLQVTLAGRHPWQLATPDSIARGDNLRLVEHKLVGSRIAHHWTSSNSDAGQVAPAYVVAQVQWQIDVARSNCDLLHCDLPVEKCDVTALFNLEDFAILGIQYDKKLCDAMVQIVGAFWNDNVLAEKPPSEETAVDRREYFRSIYPCVKYGGMVRPSSEELAVLNDATTRRQQAKDRIAIYEREILEAEADMLKIIGDREGVSGDGFRFSQITNREKQGRVNWKAIAEAQAGGLVPLKTQEQHRGQSTRSLHVKKGK
jgi:putative phage-type endonuclease